MKNIRVGAPPPNSKHWKVTCAARYKNPWSLEEEYFIKNNFRKMTDLEMSVSLKRTYSAVFNRRVKLRCLRYHTMPIGFVIRIANEELESVKDTFNKVKRMNDLILLCQNETSLYKLDKYKEELKQLSGL